MSPGLFEKVSIEECIDEEAYEVMRTPGQEVDAAVAAHEAGVSEGLEEVSAEGLADIEDAVWP